MTSSTNGARGSRWRTPQPSTHLYAIGQQVRLSGQRGPAETYEVIGTLPPRDNSPQYRVRNEEERYERVITENLLEPANVAASSSLMERTFGNG